MFLKTFGTYIRLQCLPLAELLLHPLILIFFFFRKRLAVLKSTPGQTMPFVRETSYALSTTTIINKVTHFKSTRYVAHEFLNVEMELQQPPRTTYLVTAGPRELMDHHTPFYPTYPP
jgi:hypothetical protein